MLNTEIEITSPPVSQSRFLLVLDLSLLQHCNKPLFVKHFYSSSKSPSPCMMYICTSQIL